MSFDQVHSTKHPAHPKQHRCSHPSIDRETKGCGCGSVLTCRCGYQTKLPEDHHLIGCRHYKGCGGAR